MSSNKSITNGNPRHFLTDLDLSSAEQLQVLELAAEMKTAPDNFRTPLKDKVLGMIFTKSSTRTRVSFEAGAIQLGGQAIFLSADASQMGRGEPISDTGAVLSRYLDILMIRTYKHEDIRALASASRVPVINGLDDTYHPCQILADLQTIRENFTTARGKQLVFIGDGNNMAHSLMLGGARAGLNVTIIAPKEYFPNAALVTKAQEVAAQEGCVIAVSDNIADVSGADVVYTDVWASMGQEDEASKRQSDFAPYQVTQKVMASAKEEAIFLHCLPAHRDEEVAAEVIDGPQSKVFDQAENRLHAQKALMAFLTRSR